MSNIFDIPPPSEAKIVSDALLVSINSELQRRVNVHIGNFNLFWYSKQATPQQICDEMGSNAALFFAIAQENVEHIGTVAAMVGKTVNDFLTPQQYVPPKTVTINPDGTATIGE